MNSNLIFILWGFVISSVITFVLIPGFIELLERYNFWKKIREEALSGKATEFTKLHSTKAGTPTMGGFIILFVVFLLVSLSIMAHLLGWKIDGIISLSLKYSLWNREETYLPLFTLFTVGAIGCIDDYLNIREIWRTKGLSARVKMALLLLFATMGAWWFYSKLGYHTMNIPFFGDIGLSIIYIPLFILIVVSMANSVNITDGLDGLAGWLLLFNYTVYAFICYNKDLYILSALCMIISGSLIAFLWFNVKPAKFYMGDLGSLSLGATLAIIAMMTDTLVILLVTGSLFILETISVIVQMASKKLRNGKKIFRIAPFHHHLEAIGWKEETIVQRFWLIGIVLSFIWLILSASAQL